MNIQDPISTDPAIQSPQDDSSASERKPEKDKDSKSFAKMLADKAGKKAEKGKDIAVGATPDPAQTAQPASFRETAPVAQQTKQVSTAALPPAMQNLVQEIAVASGPRNRAKVDIQLDSKTFDGLKVSIAHGADGNVSIQMVSRTPEVAAVLNRNVDQLAQALAARGVPVESIRVQTVSASASARSDTRGGDPRGGGAGQSNRSGRQT